MILTNGYNELAVKPPIFFVDKVFSKIDDEYRDNITVHMLDTICDFSQNNPVYLVKPSPEMIKNVPLTMFKSSTLNNSKERIKITVEEYNQRHNLAFKMQDAAVKQCGVKILNPLPYLCDSKYCYGDIDGIPLYFDDDHLSSYGSEVISPIYDEVFK